MQSFFVSSTFRDMQAERDALHRLVMPRLREKAKTCGESVQFVDLRWGISTSDMDTDAGAKKILSVCLDEIRKCRPYMIVLLGERYGWMPPPEMISGAARSMDFSPETGSMSVTELEIRYGLYLAQGQLDRLIFCFRDPIDPTGLTPSQQAVYLPAEDADRARMTALREKIAATPGAKILRYSLQPKNGAMTGTDAFAEALSQTLEDLLMPLWSDRRQLQWQARQREEDRLVTQAHCASFVGRTRELQEINTVIDRHPLTILEGEGGCGKSALMAKLAQIRGSTYERCHVFCCGNSSSCMTALQLVKLLCWQVQQGTQQPHQTLPDDAEQADWVELWQRLARTYSGTSVTLFLDAIDQLTPDQDLFESIFIPPVISPRLRFVVSTTGAVRINPLALPQGQQGSASLIVKLSPPEEGDLREILRARFAAEHKQVSQKVEDAVLENPCSRNMLGMEVLVRRLVMLEEKDFREISQLEQTMDGNTAIETYLLQITGKLSKNLNDLINDYFDAVCEFLAPGHISVPQLPLYIIAMLQHGISTAQLEHLAHFVLTDSGCSSIPADHAWKTFWDPVVFAQTKRYMGGLLMERTDGRIDYTHRLLREALRSRYGANNIASILRYWLFFQPHEDQTRLENMLMLTRMHHQNELDHDEPLNIEFETVDAFFHSVIRDAGNLEDHDDPVKAAEGKRQMEILLRCITTDLLGSQRRKNLNLYTKILENAMENNCGPNYYTIWFFSTRVIPELSRQGEAEKALCAELMFCIVSGLTAQQKRLETLPADHKKQWTELAWRRFLQYHGRILQLLADIRVSRREGRVRVQNFYGMTAKSVYENALAVGERCRKAAPDEPIVSLRLATLHSYMAAVKLDDLFTGSCPRYLDQAMKEIRLAHARVRAGENQKRLDTYNGHLLYITARTGELLLSLYSSRIIAPRRYLNRALALFRSVSEEVDHLQVSSVEDSAFFADVWGECVYRESLEYKDEPRKQRVQQAADIRGACYYALRQRTGTLSPKDRERLAHLAADLADHLSAGYTPKAMTDAGMNRTQTCRMIVEKEGGYLQAQARSDFDSRRSWSRLLVLETLCRSANDPALCVETARQAIAVLEPLLAECKEHSYLFSFSPQWIQNDIDFMNRLIEKYTPKIGT